MLEKRKIEQYDKNGKLLHKWPSIYSAACHIADIKDKCDIRAKNVGICHCLAGRQRTAYGFVWKYADEKLY